MLIENVKYLKYKGQGDNIGIMADIDSIGTHIPLDPNNKHYQAIQEWVAEGNTIEEAD
jgi:hypothetical protein